MSDTFRTKVRIKRLKQIDSIEWQNRINEQYRKAARDAWRDVPHDPPLIAKPRCPRCGINWSAGPMGYCCPHGNMCGVPNRLPDVPSFTMGSGCSITPPNQNYQVWG